MEKRQVRKRVIDSDEYDEGEDYLATEFPQPMRNSIHMHAVGKNITPCVIDGYYFNWLYSMNDYVLAGHNLKLLEALGKMAASGSSNL